jgi:hypothetical protein
MALIKGLTDVVKVPVEFTLLTDEDEPIEIKFLAHFKRKTRSELKERSSEAQQKLKKLHTNVNMLRKLDQDSEEFRQTEQVIQNLSNEIDQVIFDALIGWTGLEDSDGNHAEFNEENKAALFDSPPYFEAIRQAYVYADGNYEGLVAKNS